MLLEDWEARRHGVVVGSGELGQLLENHEEIYIFKQKRRREKARAGGRRGGRDSLGSMKQQGDGSRQAKGKPAVFWERRRCTEYS